MNVDTDDHQRQSFGVDLISVDMSTLFINSIDMLTLMINVVDLGTFSVHKRKYEVLRDFHANQTRVAVRMAQRHVTCVPFSDTASSCATTKPMQEIIHSLSAKSMYINKTPSSLLFYKHLLVLVSLL
jgi:hypothetical protein